MKEVAPGILQLSIPTPFPVGPVNVYLLEGEPLTLVDAGPRTEDAFEVLKAGLSELGYSVSDVEQVVITPGVIVNNEAPMITYRKETKKPKKEAKQEKLA